MLRKTRIHPPKSADSTELGLLTNLIYLDPKTSKNPKTHFLQIPTELGLLTNLIYLDLSYNLLSGGVPTQLGSLTKARRRDEGGEIAGGGVRGRGDFSLPSLDCGRLSTWMQQ